jgi:hypothetical protein
MPYDSNLDECLFQKQFETETSRITVSVYSYNQGAKKLQITRENRGPQGEFRYTRLGRMSKEEIEGILPNIKEAMQAMD